MGRGARSIIVVGGRPAHFGPTAGFQGDVQLAHGGALLSNPRLPNTRTGERRL